MPANAALEGFRLSPQQKRTWLLQSLSSHENPFCAQCNVRLQGVLYVDQLQQALQQIVDGRDVLRTTFHRPTGMKVPIQAIAERGSFTWERQDVTSLSPEQQQARADIWHRQQRQSLLDAEQSPLRVGLLRLSDTEHLLLLSLPSLCADSWTLQHMVSELARTYADRVSGNVSTDEETSVQYLQFSEWQNELTEDEEDEDARAGFAYWQEKQLQSRPALQLPTGQPEVATDGFVPRVRSWQLVPEMVEALYAIATTEGTNFAESLLACWNILLWRLTDRPDLACSVLFANRKYEEFQDILGLLGKWLPVPCRLHPQRTFRQTLCQLNRTLEEIDTYQEYFLWEEFPQQASNIVDCPFAFEFESRLHQWDAGGLSWYWQQQYTCSDRFQIKLACAQTPAGTILEFHYDASRFCSEDVERLAASLQALAASAVQHPDTPVSTLNLLDNNTQHNLLVAFNETQTSYPSNGTGCFHECFEACAARTPDQIAVVGEGGQLSYRDLNARANQLARYLQQEGVEPETIVGLYASRSVEAIVGILGIFKAGGAYLPLDPDLPSEGVAWRLCDVRASLVLTEQSLYEKCQDLPARIFCLDADWPVVAGGERSNLPNQTSPSHLAYTIFTSGSTGKPKGVAVEHRQLANYAFGLLDRLQIPEGKSFATVSTLAADLGHTAVFSALCSSGCLHLISSNCARDPQALADYFRQHTIDVLKIVPSHLQALLAASPSADILPHQCLIVGGEATSWELVKIVWQRRPRCRIVNHYGPTETTVGALTYEATTLPSGEMSDTMPIGHPLANVRAYVLDKYGQPVPEGVPGELYIGGAGVARGYLNRPEQTAERFLPDRFAVPSRCYRTGDIVRYTGSGHLVFLGRRDRQVKLRGFRIEPEEIETTLNQHPDVRQAAVVVWEESPDNKQLVAYMVSHPKRTLTSEELRHFLGQKLADYMVPSVFVFLKALPLMPNGKLDRQALPVPRATSQPQRIPPRTPLETQLAEIWAQVLETEPVGRNENFFELGGHSLLLTQLLVRVRDGTGAVLSLQDLLAAPTVADLANAIETKQSANGSAMASQLGKDVVLDEAISPNTSPSEAATDPHAVFLTGATGFLGAFLLRELLQQTRAKIYCLVRSSDNNSVQQRLRETVTSYGLWEASWRDRVVAVAGDLSQPQFGWSEEQFRQMGRAIDAIYHNGAWVHHTFPYQTLKATNVTGTQEILRLAVQGSCKPVHFVSTTSVFVPEEDLATGMVREGESLCGRRVPEGGYAQSKWVAEQIVALARDRGVPVCIYRPSRISGDSQSGVFNTNDFFYRLVLGCLQLGTVPQSDATFDLVPVDYVSRAIVQISQQKSSWGKAFHLTNPHPLSANRLVNWLQSLGYAIEPVSYQQWYDQLLDIARREPEHPLYSLVPFFPAPSSQASPATQLAFDRSHTLAALTDTSITCPPVDEQLLRTYFSYLDQQGFLKNNKHQAIEGFTVAS